MNLRSHGARAVGLIALIIAAIHATACASLRPRVDEDFRVSGPGELAILGNTLFVEDEFWRVVRMIDLDTGRSRRLELPGTEMISDFTTHADHVVVHGYDRAWRVDATGQLVDIPKPVDLASGLLERLPASLQPSRGKATYVGDAFAGSNGDIYFATGSDFAIGRRIWRLSTSGELSTVVGPWSVVENDPRPSGHAWYPKSLSAPVLDGRGGLWFIDYGRGRRMILRADLRTGAIRFIEGKVGEADPRDPYGERSDGHYVAMAADAAGNIYASDYGGQRVVRIDPESGRMSTVARVGGRRRPIWFSDVVIRAPEPPDIRCDERAESGAFVIEVTDTSGGAIPSAEVYRVGRGFVDTAVLTDANGLARFEVPASTELSLVVNFVGFAPTVVTRRASAGCISTDRVQLEVLAGE